MRDALGSAQRKAQSKSNGPLGVRHELKSYAAGVQSRVGDASGWRFVFRGGKCKSSGPEFSYTCAQDVKNGRSRDGKARKTDETRGHDKTRWPCGGSLSISVDLWREQVTVIFKHSHAHPPYNSSRFVTLETRNVIRELWTSRLTIKPSKIFAAMRDRAKREHRPFETTGDQVRFVISGLRKELYDGDDDVNPNETEVQATERMCARIAALEPEEWVEESDAYWEVVMLRVPTFNDIGEKAVEIALDGTHGTTEGGWELCVVLAEHMGSGYPLSYLALRPKASRRGKTRANFRAMARSRLAVMERWLLALRRRGVNPDFIHCDKDFSEISAIQRVWAGSKASLCMWHAEKAIDQRLRGSKNKKRTIYYPSDAKAIIPHLDLAFLPSHHNPVNLNRTRPGLKAAEQAARAVSLSNDQFARFDPNYDPSAPAPLDPPSSVITPHPVSARFVLSAKTRETYLETEGAPQYTPEVRAQMPRVELAGIAAELGDAVVEDWDVAEDGAEDDWKSSEFQSKKIYAARRRAQDGRAAPPKSDAICSVRHRGKIITLFSKHFCQHPSIPFEEEGSLTADEIYRRAARQMYDYCKKADLADSWAYLWENWYRPGRWTLWARSAYHEIPVWRTTMSVEAHWRALKYDYLERHRRTSLRGLFWTIGECVIPHMKLNLEELHEGDDNLDWRKRKSTWRLPFRGEFKKAWKKFDDWDAELRRRDGKSERRSVAEKENGGAQDQYQCRYDARRLSDIDSDNLDGDDIDLPEPFQSAAPSHPVRQPLLSISTNTVPNSSIDPTLLPPSNNLRPGRPGPRNYRTDAVAGVCACPAFLRSRFLICKHVIATYPERPSQRWFNTVARHRTVPIWRVPPHLEERGRLHQQGLHVTRTGGVEDKEPEGEEPEGEEEDEDSNIYFHRGASAASDDGQDSNLDMAEKSGMEDESEDEADGGYEAGKDRGGKSREVLLEGGESEATAGLGAQAMTEAGASGRSGTPTTLPRKRSHRQSESPDLDTDADDEAEDDDEQDQFARREGVLRNIKLETDYLSGFAPRRDEEGVDVRFLEKYLALVRGLGKVARDEEKTITAGGRGASRRKKKAKIGRSNPLSIAG